MGSNTILNRLTKEFPMSPVKDSIVYIKPVYKFDRPKKIGDNLYEVKEKDAFEIFNQIWLIF